MKRLVLFIFFLLTCMGAADRAKNAAIVKVVRGQAEVVGQEGPQNWPKVCGLEKERP